MFHIYDSAHRAHRNNPPGQRSLSKRACIQRRVVNVKRFGTLDHRSDTDAVTERVLKDLAVFIIFEARGARLLLTSACKLLAEY